MKRTACILVALALVAGGIWFAGRAPSEYVLQAECRRMLDERAGRHDFLQYRLAQEEKAGADTSATRKEIEGLYRLPKRLKLRGWEVVLIPPGGVRPDPEGFLDVGVFDTSRKDDPPLLRGAVRVWIKPTSALARLFAP